MTEIKLNQETLKDPESVAEIEGIIDSALELKGSDGHRILNTLLTGYLQKHFDEDDPDHLDEIDEVAEFCELLGKHLQQVNRSNFK